MALTNKLEAIADAIREKTNTTDTMTLDEMATAISGITGGGGGECTLTHIPEEKLVLTDDCGYKFYKGAWDWFIEEYGDKITSRDIYGAQYMFGYCTLKSIPFEVNLATIKDGGAPINYLCQYSKLKTPPYVTGTIGSISGAFSYSDITEIPEDWADKINWDYVHSYAYAGLQDVFRNCEKLRTIPQTLIDNLWGQNTTTPYCAYKNEFSNCSILEQINALPVHPVAITSNFFGSTFDKCFRLNKMTFATQEDGTPNVASWKSQTIDLSINVGYASATQTIAGLQSYHGITNDTQVTDDASYQTLKDHPDWHTAKIKYSRYNHDSAVETINSLPDTSAYLAANGGTNTIKFKGEAGELTDGGAINTLTEEEIAVATAKGWTVTLS